MWDPTWLPNLSGRRGRGQALNIESKVEHGARRGTVGRRIDSWLMLIFCSDNIPMCFWG